MGDGEIMIDIDALKRDGFSDEHIEVFTKLDSGEYIMYDPELYCIICRCTTMLYFDPASGTCEEAFRKSVKEFSDHVQECTGTVETIGGTTVRGVLQK